MEDKRIDNGTNYDVLLTDYKVYHDGYINRDSMVPKEFHQMLQCFVVLVALVSGTGAFHTFNIRVELFIFLVVFIIGTLSLGAYAVNIEAKASVKRALRRRMVEIEESIPSDHLQYWKAVACRKYLLFENVYKKRDKKNNRVEKRSASCFFVVSARILLSLWFIVISLLFFWDQVFK